MITKEAPSSSFTRSELRCVVVEEFRLRSHRKQRIAAPTYSQRRLYFSGGRERTGCRDASSTERKPVICVRRLLDSSKTQVAGSSPKLSSLGNSSAAKKSDIPFVSLRSSSLTKASGSLAFVVASTNSMSERFRSCSSTGNSCQQGRHQSAQKRDNT